MNSYFIFCASDFYLPNVTALASSLKYAVTSIPLFLLTETVVSNENNKESAR